MKLKFKNIVSDSEKKCKICDRECSKDGIIIMKNSICKDCIEDIIKSDINDIKYDNLKDKIKDIWSRVK